MIWQDFMFACSMYQANDVFLASVAEEVKHQVIKQDDLFTRCGVTNLERKFVCGPKIRLMFFNLQSECFAF